MNYNVSVGSSPPPRFSFDVVGGRACVMKIRSKFNYTGKYALNRVYNSVHNADYNVHITVYYRSHTCKYFAIDSRVKNPH